jgi:hypothetical protein
MLPLIRRDDRCLLQAIPSSWRRRQDLVEDNCGTDSTGRLKHPHDRRPFARTHRTRLGISGGGFDAKYKMLFLDIGMHVPLTDIALDMPLADGAQLGNFHVVFCHRFPADWLLRFWLALRAFAFWTIPL